MFKTTIAAANESRCCCIRSCRCPYVSSRSLRQCRDQCRLDWRRLHRSNHRSSCEVGASIPCYEGPVGESASYYVQVGASVVSPDGAESDTVPSGKAGLGVALSDSLGAYGELSFIGSGDADVDRGYGGKLGLKYNF